ncbi:MAG: sigma70-ECF: polymerase sigma factor, sigma-70 family [Chthonomonadaceae bacterium]|nr:sigma70-ECF: polymerase sigma factor, sigma-70 family [Chthonomonadaceae bacterium]
MQTDPGGQYAYAAGERTRLAGIETDRRLITDVINGKGRACEEFVCRYRRVIYAVLNRYTLTADEREDLFQQVFVHLWDHRCLRLSQWQPDGTGRFSSFLCVLVGRLAVDHFRAIRRSASGAATLISLEEDDCGSLASALPDPHQQVCDAERRQILKQAIQRLSPRDSDLLQRRYYRQQTYAEIAEALGITIGHMGVALQRAHTRLRKELCREHADLFSSSYAPGQERRSAAKAIPQAGKQPICCI